MQSRAGAPLPASRTQPREAGEHFPNTADGAAPLHGWRTEREQTGASYALPIDPSDQGAAAKVVRGIQSQGATARIPPCPTARGSVPGAGLERPSASNPATSPVGAGRSPAGVVPPAVAAVERLTRLIHEAERRRDGLLAGLRAEEQEIATLLLERDAVHVAFETQRAVREELTGGDALARAIVEDAEASRGGAS